MCTLPGKIKTYILPWLIKCSSVHLAATLSNLNHFNSFCTADTGKNVQNVACIYLFVTFKSAANDIITVWLFAYDNIMNHAIDEWRRRLSACVDAEGGHFEHYYWLLLSR